MCWGKGQCPNSKCNDELLYTDGTKVVSSKSPKYQLRGSIQRGDVSLTIINTNENDQSVYCCRIEVPGWFNDVKRNIRLDLRRGKSDINQKHHIAAAHEQEKPTIDVHFLLLFAPETSFLVQNEVEPEQIRMTSNYELLMIIAPSLGFVLLALLLAFFLRVEPCGELKKILKLDSPLLSWFNCHVGDLGFRSFESISGNAGPPVTSVHLLMVVICCPFLPLICVFGTYQPSVWISSMMEKFGLWFLLFLS
ncbi:hypothetical protein MJG53_007758 [Ovis ammon polii x Ovis aries]|uniref:Uncharacterized protein n=1 Tax=Ovis ammon polii x Ovis aries TaxID=2918886 RepID=A0ACB9V3I3_9CETA|nr:hypothetical protein MJG53_007758 [Ovis ammon polii x Ovis aries]